MQMFLNHSLYASSLGNTLVHKAQAHTGKALQGKYGKIDFSKVYDRYFAVQHFAMQGRDGADGVEFAHKTVGEYFTAVKLYEDYLAFDFSEEVDINTVWENIFKAFRYEKIPEDIMTYLVDIIKKRMGTGFKDWKGKFFDCYFKGMLEEALWKQTNVEKKYESKQLLPEDVAIAFRNLTWLLTLLGFTNENNDFAPKDWKRYRAVYASYFAKGVSMDINCSAWKNLSDRENNIYLRGVDLLEANLSKAHLIGADLFRADLFGADLIEADLRKADLRSVHLIGADLSEADLSVAYLSGAYLSGADLRGAILENITLFESDLPEWDEYIEKGVRLSNPNIIERKLGHVGWLYNPETNRLEPPKKQILH